MLRSEQWDTNPADSQAWEWADIDALQIGVSLKGGGDFPESFHSECTQVYVEVDYTITAPTVTTQAVTNIDTTTATGNGNITATGGENASKRGVCWSETSNPSAYKLSFDGTGDYVEVSDSASLNPGTGNFTVGAWIKSSEATTRCILAKRGTGEANTPIYGLWIISDELEMNVRDTANTLVTCHGTITVNDGVWHHIVGVRTGNSIEIFVDAVSDGTASGTISNVNPANNPLLVGRHSSNNAQDFNGNIDEARIYNRALSPAEIQQCYQGSPPANGRVLDLPMSEGSGNTVYDGSGEGNDGTIVGASWTSQGDKAEDNGAGSYGTGAFSKSMTGLTPGQKYYVKAYATNSAGTGYGGQVDFSTLADISNAPSSKAFGNVSENTSYWSKGSAPSWPLDDAECYFTVTNNSSGAISITIKATNFIGGNGWTLTSGTPGSATVRMKAGKSGDANEAAMVTLTTGEQSFISALAGSATKKWEIKMETGTFTDGVLKSSTVTLTATLD